MALLYHYCQIAFKSKKNKVLLQTKVTHKTANRPRNSFKIKVMDKVEMLTDLSLYYRRKVLLRNTF